MHKQLILQSGIYVLLSSGLFHIRIINCSSMSNVREHVLGDFKNQNQTDRAIKL